MPDLDMDASRPGVRRPGLIVAVAGWILLSGLSGCGNGVPDADGNRLFLVSREAAEAIGRQGYADEIAKARQANSLDRDHDQVRLVAGITDRLVEVARRRYPIGRDWQWEMHVLTSPEINASCAPGGKMQVLSGLLEAAGMNPDRIATVVGHEIAHALLEHARSSLSRDWLLHSGMWIVSKSLKLGVVRSESARAEIEAVFLPMSRELEREADVLGLRLMAEAGYDPGEGVLFWQDAAAGRAAAGAGEKRLEAFLSTHPTDEERQARLTELARQWRTPSQEARP